MISFNLIILSVLLLFPNDSRVFHDFGLLFLLTLNFIGARGCLELQIDLNADIYSVFIRAQEINAN